jgi:hypothetical protein
MVDAGDKDMLLHINEGILAHAFIWKADTVLFSDTVCVLCLQSVNFIVVVIGQVSLDVLTNSPN